jgi:peptide chain release factor 1
MLDSTRAKLRAVAERQREVERLMALPVTVSDPGALKRLGREYNQLQRFVGLFSKYEKAEESLRQTRQLIEAERDPEVLQLAKSEVEELEASLADLTSRIEEGLVPEDVTAHADAVVEIRAGAGGEEAGLFAAELFRMYQRYGERNGWKTEVLNLSDTGIGGIKEVVFEVSGEGTFTRLKHESGVHRVQRVPATESSGRIHTSTATVAVLPKAEEIDVKVNDADLKIDIYHSSGAGGQNVQKVATAVRITHLPTGLVVACQNERSQLQNKTRAMEVLRARLWDMELRKQQEAISADRRAQVGTGDRSEKIRTYNFPQSRVTDHRINHTSHNMQRVLDGDLDEFTDALLREEQARKLTAATVGA